ncbi:sialate O-acetylesterase [Coraliomargarita algicola]|uniref:Sialate O-acetylesterase n=1 Tax=Coraliomargarita algicola TaxID=3092156 RepID=A0ABZ0RMY6_9BACT|nr:sialate O-acetylesterase [Coraliomargarita sp. J2-16]WPJ96125.1 sialate O-acetylesterase [Coraliomargarita sp. J2-16]
MDIYLLIGQSNMAGRAEIPIEDMQPMDGCHLLNIENLWEPAKNPLNRYSSIRGELQDQKMGPGYLFAQTMRQAQPNIEIGLVVNAKGNTKIDQWIKGTLFYEQAVLRTRIALRTGKLKGILWHQGEASRNDTDYLVKLQQLIKSLRTDLGDTQTPFIAGQINRIDENPFNEMILRLPSLVEHTRVVTTEDLTASDLWHFDTQSMKTLGKRYAEKMLELQNECSILP